MNGLTHRLAAALSRAMMYVENEASPEELASMQRVLAEYSQHATNDLLIDKPRGFSDPTGCPAEAVGFAATHDGDEGNYHGREGG